VPTAEDQLVEIASYADSWRIPVRLHAMGDMSLGVYSIPLRVFVYLLVLVPAAYVATQLPVIGTVLGLVPWWAVNVAAPIGLSFVFGAIEPGGRAFHHAARSWVLGRLRPSTHLAFRASTPAGGRWRPPPLMLLPDGSEPTFCGLEYQGPGVVEIRAAAREIRYQPGVADRVLRRPTREYVQLDGPDRVRHKLIVAGESVRFVSAGEQ